MDKKNKPDILYLILIVILGFGLCAYFLDIGVIATIIGFVTIVLGILSVRYSIIGRVIDSVVIGYLKFAVGFFIASGLAFLFRGLNAITVGLSSWLLLVLLVLWGTLLAVAIWYLIVEKQRTWLFGWLRNQIGWGAPFAYSYALMWSGIFFFASLTYTFIQVGWLMWDEPNGREITMSSINDFYFWHFINAIPAYKVTDTLLMVVPLQYENSSVGFILLLFKIVVISPVIGAFITYWRDSGKEKKEEQPKVEAREQETLKLVRKSKKPKPSTRRDSR